MYSQTFPKISTNSLPEQNSKSFTFIADFLFFLYSIFLTSSLIISLRASDSVGLTGLAFDLDPLIDISGIWPLIYKWVVIWLTNSLHHAFHIFKVATAAHKLFTVSNSCCTACTLTPSSKHLLPPTILPDSSLLLPLPHSNLEEVHRSWYPYHHTVL